MNQNGLKHRGHLNFNKDHRLEKEIRPKEIKEIGGYEKMINLLRKTAAAAILIFILSIVPAALAERGNANRVELDVRGSVNLDGSVTENETPDAEVKSEDTVRVEIKEKVLGTEEKSRLRINMNDEVKEEKSGDSKDRLRIEQESEVKTRLKMSRVNKERAQENYERAKERYLKARNRFKEHKENLLEFQNQAHQCRAKEDSEKKGSCREEKNMLKRGVKEHLLKMVEVMLKSIEKLSHRVEAAEKVDDADTTAALQTLAELKLQVEEQTVKIEALSVNSTAVEIRTTMKDLKDLWKEIRQQERRIIALLVNAKVDTLLEKEKGLLRSMEARITAAERAGEDTTELQAIKARFAALRTDLETKYNVAKEKWQNADNKEEALTEWRKSLQEIKEGMKDLQQILREFVRTFRGLRISSGANLTAAVNTSANGEIADGQIKVTTEK